MRVESRDSLSLKPAELDEFGQLLVSVELPLKDDALDDHIGRFPLVTRTTADDELHGFLFGSLERIGGTPCILWGLGAIRRGRQARVALDLSGRAFAQFSGHFPRETVGALPTELVPHFFRSLAEALGAALHVSVTGENTHHMIEACFKGVGRALRQALRREGTELPSTKGIL